VETIDNDEVYIDDYAHHFNEIKATLQAARARYSKRKIIAIFRPDRHSRILKFVIEFKEALAQADIAYVVNFPPTSINDTKEVFDAKILCDNNKIIFFDESELSYQNLAAYHNVVYVFMSSKDLSAIARKIRENKW
jgi:UDP-N-acetylmuramate--alanine ligase